VEIMGFLILLVLFAIETLFFVWTIKDKKNRSQERGIVRLGLFALFGVLLLTGVFQWGFRWYFLTIILTIQTVISVVVLVRKKEKPYALGKNIRKIIGNGICYAFAVLPIMLFLPYIPITPTGSYTVDTAKYTWVDKSRTETLTDTGENRALTVEFWYPKEVMGKVPLIIFSHGAFGFSGSNESTFIDLASNGYVVASIGHTYHAFFTSDTNGKMTFANADFINSINAANAADDPVSEYHLSREWLDIRIADINFVMDIISAMTADADAPLFSIIDLENIGAIGHSLGGAALAQTARERNDINAVINLDGSLLGEGIGVENGKVILNSVPYPVPLLTIYSEYFYQMALGIENEEFVNFHVHRNAEKAYEIIFKDSGHINFTDLPLFSPFLANFFGSGTVNARYCIETTNRIVLEFFDYYLKSGEVPNFEREY
jgi:dienelactone hydrolase